jgi:hypothetical protein
MWLFFTTVQIPNWLFFFHVQLHQYPLTLSRGSWVSGLTLTKSHMTFWIYIFYILRVKGYWCNWTWKKNNQFGICTVVKNNHMIVHKTALSRSEIFFQWLPFSSCTEISEYLLNNMRKVGFFPICVMFILYHNQDNMTI